MVYMEVYMEDANYSQSGDETVKSLTQTGNRDPLPLSALVVF